MTFKTGLGALAFAAAVTLGGQAAAATTVTSTFDTGTDGWSFGTYQGVGATQPVTYDAQAGAITKLHGFGGWGFVAPLKYLGDKSEFIGGALSFDLSSVLHDYKTQSLVAFTGANGQTIFSRLTGPPGPQLQGFTIGLTAGSFYSGAPSQVTGAVSTAKFEAIMGDLEQIQIFGDWGGNVDNVALDNVSMGSAAVPEPATWAMMILGFGAAGAAIRRRRAAFA